VPHIGSPALGLFPAWSGLTHDLHFRPTVILGGKAA